MGISKGIGKYVFIAGMILVCVVLTIIFSGRGNSNSQANPVDITLKGIGNEGDLSLQVSNIPVLENTDSEKIQSSESITQNMDPDNELAFMEEEISNEEAAGLRRAFSEAMNKNLTTQEYIKKHQNGPLRYSQTRELISKDDLPILYELLDDDEYAPNWRAAVETIGFISDDPESVNVLLKFIQRNDNDKLNKNSIYSKICAFAMIGLIGGDTADSILRKSVTEEGARELAKDWIDEQVPGSFDSERMVSVLQQYSLQGLVLSGKPENITLVEKLYNDEKEASLNNNQISNLMWALIDAMAIKDYITDAGLDTYMDKKVSGTALGAALGKYINKYMIVIGN